LVKENFKYLLISVGYEQHGNNAIENWRKADGSEIEYENWGFGQPDKEHEICAQVNWLDYTNYKWHDTTCGNDDEWVENAYISCRFEIICPTTTTTRISTTSLTSSTTTTTTTATTTKTTTTTTTTSCCQQLYQLQRPPHVQFLLTITHVMSVPGQNMIQDVAIQQLTNMGEQDAITVAFRIVVSAEMGLMFTVSL